MTEPSSARRRIGAAISAAALSLAPGLVRCDGSAVAAGEAGRQAVLREAEQGIATDPSSEAFGHLTRTALLWGAKRECVRIAVGALSHADKEVRVRALGAIGTLGVPAASEEVVAALKDPESEVRRAALSTLVRMHAKEAAGAVAELLVPEEEAMRRAAAPVADQAESAPIGVPGDSPTRQAVLSALGILGSPESAGRIAPFLAHPEGATRKEAAMALGRLRAREQWPGILPLLSDAERDVKIAAVSAAVLIGEPSAGASVAPLVSDADLGVAVSAVTALSAIGAKDQLGAILPVLSHAAPEARVEGLRAVAALGARSEVPAAAACLEDGNGYVQLEAAFAMGRLLGIEWDLGEPPDPMKAVAQARAWWAEHKTDPDFSPKPPAEAPGE